MRFGLGGLGLTLYLVCAQAMADAAPEDFYGTYAGSTTDITGDIEVRRDLGVIIAPTKDGFRVDWTTVSIRENGRTKRTRRSIEFHPSNRENIFVSAMRSNVFGGRQPLDPMKGDPYVWARVQDNTMTVHALVITDEGGYEMLTYNRTLSDQGLNLVFDRVKDGKPQKRIEAVLKRMDR